MGHRPRLVWCAAASHVGRGQRPPQASYRPILEILKTTRFGINAALKGKQSAMERRTQSKQTNQIETNMLSKLNKRRGGFTLVEIMIVVAIIALLAAIAVPGFLRARKRSQATKILNDLRMIDAAVDQYAIETNRATGSIVAITDWTSYLKSGTVLYNTGNDLFGNAYGAQKVDTLPSVPQARGTPCRMWLPRTSGLPTSSLVGTQRLSRASSRLSAGGRSLLFMKPKLLLAYALSP